MTWCVSDGTLKLTHSLTHSLTHPVFWYKKASSSNYIMLNLRISGAQRVVNQWNGCCVLLVGQVTETSTMKYICSRKISTVYKWADYCFRSASDTSKVFCKLSLKRGDIYSEEEDLCIYREVRYEGADPLRFLSWRGLHQIKLAYDKSASMPARLVTDPLLHITHRFFPSGGRNRLQYSLHRTTESWPGCMGLNDLDEYQDGRPVKSHWCNY